ncbi:MULTISPECIES: sirohydrochlorin chelatase [Prauserella salsuginis group]|uniref:Sirohydrochlorin chelatase n=1 Tax=Prauserella salsuginis TaxID=387889 RepID=A0ABW6G6I1_9PSEU|nr:MULTISPECIES: sirohydrochlorin chelatase [Prauserella salsuginis group]MCR3722805.1 Sirohydrochlorin ferrochelatase [Prauserella flava]MCR3737140.1 Sirohydrochlorin ferrochelatase [Prauserella salsuginis]
MIVLTAHGTRDPAGAEVIAELAGRVRARGAEVAVAYADVREPDVTTVLNGLAGRSGSADPVVLPAFLAAGYHVRTDIPQQVAASALPRAPVAEAFGPAPELIDVLVDRVRQAGYRPGDAVVLAAAGSSDPRALDEVSTAARMLSARLRAPVRIGYAATADPDVAAAVAEARHSGRRVLVASWLLAPGLFQRRLEATGADAVSAPLGAHPAVADLVVRRCAETPDTRAEPAGWDRTVRLAV